MGTKFRFQSRVEIFSLNHSENVDFICVLNLIGFIFRMFQKKGCAPPKITNCLKRNQWSRFTRKISKKCKIKRHFRFRDCDRWDAVRFPGEDQYNVSHLFLRFFLSFKRYFTLFSEIHIFRHQRDLKRLFPMMT